MTEQNEIVKYFHTDEVYEKIAEIVGDLNAKSFINSVLLTVLNDETGRLQKCTPVSILISAARAATLRLSVDRSLGQAWLVPYGITAELIVGYKGYYDMAVRTNQYRYINVAERYEGETTTPDPITGLITMACLGGKRISDKVIGYLAAFERMNGFAHTIYMTVEEIHEHAKTYSKAYFNEKSPWQSKNKKTVQGMERKTVLRILLTKWGYMEPYQQQVLAEVEEPIIEAQANDVPGEQGTNSITIPVNREL